MHLRFPIDDINKLDTADKFEELIILLKFKVCFCVLLTIAATEESTVRVKVKYDKYDTLLLLLKQANIAALVVVAPLTISTIAIEVAPWIVCELFPDKFMRHQFHVPDVDNDATNTTFPIPQATIVVAEYTYISINANVAAGSLNIVAVVVGTVHVSPLLLDVVK